MTITRSRIAALGASALLIIGGASVAFAQNPAVPATPEAVEDPATGPDLDNIQEGDQTGADNGAEDGVEDAPGAPDTDLVEEGDQTSPDTSAQAAPVAIQAQFAKAAPLAQKAAAPAKSAADASAESESSSESESESESSAESDGPGGHEDADKNADHQFEGEE